MSKRNHDPVFLATGKRPGDPSAAATTGDILAENKRLRKEVETLKHELRYMTTVSKQWRNDAMRLIAASGEHQSEVERISEALADITRIVARVRRGGGVAMVRNFTKTNGLKTQRKGGSKVIPDEKRHAPCKNRRRETRDGVTMDWCYAIGCEEIGDMPCEYCKDRKDEVKE